jgi:triacylglycerol lipase
LLGLLALAGCGSVADGGGGGAGMMTAPGDQPMVPPPDVATCSGAPYPIILAHGMAGFERIGPLNYFFNVAADLRSTNEVVFESQVSPYDSSTVRGNELAQFVDDTLRSTGACKVNLIAHSQGGLDGRYVISTLHYGDRVAALATVGTPHRGTAVADVALGLVTLPGFPAATLNQILLAVQGLSGNDTGNPNIKANLQQLATANMAQFNIDNPDDARVKYYSVAGRSNLSAGTAECAGSVWSNPQGLDVLTPLLAAPAAVFPFVSPNPLQPVANDGLVPVPSARWGSFLGCMPADHFDEVGQIAEIGADPVSGFDHLALYRRIVAALHADKL